MYTKQYSAIILIGVVGSRTTTDSIRAVGKEKAKFHYTGPTGPARTFSRDPGRRFGSATKSAVLSQTRRRCGRDVWSGPVRVQIPLYGPDQTLPETCNKTRE